MVRIKETNQQRWASLSVLGPRCPASAPSDEAAISGKRPLENIVGFTRLTYGCTASLPELAALNVFGSTHVTNNHKFARFRFLDPPDKAAEECGWAEISRLAAGTDNGDPQTGDANAEIDDAAAGRAFALSGPGALVLGADGLRKWREAQNNSRRH